MKNQNKNLNGLHKIIKSCLHELELQIVEDVVEKDRVSIITDVKDEDISLSIELNFLSTSNLLNIKVYVPRLFETECPIMACQILNFLNAELMDIEHFSVNRNSGDVMLQTSLNLSNQNYDREQIMATIKRIINCGYKNFKSLHLIAEDDRCSFDAFVDYFGQKEESQDIEKKTIH